MNWRDQAPWADRERPGLRLLWAGVLVGILVIVGLLIATLF